MWTPIAVSFVGRGLSITTLVTLVVVVATVMIVITVIVAYCCIYLCPNLCIALMLFVGVDDNCNMCLSRISNVDLFPDVDMVDLRKI